MRLLPSLLVSLALAALPGCTSLECGFGTLQSNGKCAATATPEDGCGDGTTFDPLDGVCKRDDYLDGGMPCGPGTVLVRGDAGVSCVPAAPLACETPLPCLAPAGGRVRVCGRLWDVEETRPVDDGDASNGEPGLLVRVQAVDAAAFSGGTPTVLGAALADRCGRFALEATTPVSGWLGVLADDDAAAADGSTPTLTPVDVAGLGVVNGAAAWLARRASVALWDSVDVAGSGAVLAVFVDPAAAATGPLAGAPFAGAVVAGVAAANDHFFADIDPRARRTIDPDLAVTGADGSALVLGVAWGALSGANPPAGCAWPLRPAAAVAGVLTVLPLVAECD